MPGKKPIAEEVARDRRARWRRAAQYSGLKPEAIAEVVGKSLGTVYSYNYAQGNIPTETAIERLRQHNLQRAVELVDEKFGPGLLKIGSLA